MSTIKPSPFAAFSFSSQEGTARSFANSGSGPNVLDHDTMYWSGLVLSKEDVPWVTTQVNESVNGTNSNTVYMPITTMVRYQKSSFEELRVAHYFYNRDKTPANSIWPKAKSWERPVALPVPAPTPSISTSSFTARFPLPASTPSATESPTIGNSQAPTQSPASLNQLPPTRQSTATVQPPSGVQNSPQTPSPANRATAPVKDGQNAGPFPALLNQLVATRQNTVQPPAGVQNSPQIAPFFTRSTTVSAQSTGTPSGTTIAPNQTVAPAPVQKAGPPAQNLTMFGLGSQPSTPARMPPVGAFANLAGMGPVPPSPAAERIPAVNQAENYWEAARRTVAWRKQLLQQAQADYDKSVQLEREKFREYCATRLTLDK